MFALLGLSLFACIEKDKSSDGKDRPKDTEDSAPDSDDTAPPVEAASFVAWISLVPATIPEPGGDVVLTATTSDLTDGVCDFAWASEEAEGTATARATDATTLELTLALAGLAPGVSTITVSQTCGGETSDFGTFDMGVSGAVSDEDRWGAPADVLPPWTGNTECLDNTCVFRRHGTTTIRVDVSPSGELTWQAKPDSGTAFVGWSTPVWENDVTDATLHPSVTVTDDGAGGVIATAVVMDPDGREPVTVVTGTFDGTAWTGTTTQMAIFGAVLGLNTTKSSPFTSSTLSVDGGSVTFSDSVGSAHTDSIGTVSGSEIDSGAAFAGLFGDNDLSSDGDTLTRIWTLEPSRSGQQLTVVSPDTSTGTMSTVRQVTIPTSMDVEVATASGQDGDGDGAPELFVELWSTTGSKEVWVVPNVTDKSDARSPRLLLGTPSTGYDFFSETGGDFRVVQSSLAVGGGPRIRDIHHHPDKSVLGRPIPGGSTWLSAEEWDMADVLTDDAVEVSPVVTGMVGRLHHRGRAAYHSGRGVCHFGQCYASAGGFGGWVPGSVSGEVSVDKDDPYADGDIVYAGLGADGTTLLFSRGLFDGVDGSVMPVSMTPDGELATFAIGVGSATVTLPGGSAIGVPAASMVWNDQADGYFIGSTVPADDGTLSSSVQYFSGGSVTALDLGVVQDNPVFTAGAGPQTNVLFRNGSNHAWGTAIDFNTGGELDERVTLGKPTNPSAYTYMFWLNPSMVVNLPPKSCTHFCTSTGDVRAPGYGWETGDPIGSASPSPATLAVVPADSACGWETWYLPPGESLEARTAAASVVGSSEKDDCRDLLVPVASLDSVLDLSPLGLLASPQGELVTVIPGEAGILGRATIAEVDFGYAASADGAEPVLYGVIQGGDLNFDGYADFTVIGSTLTVFMSNGLGGFTGESVTTDAAYNSYALPSSDGTCELSSDRDPQRAGSYTQLIVGESPPA